MQSPAGARRVTTTSRLVPKRTTQSGQSGPRPLPSGSSTCPSTSWRPPRRPARPFPLPSCPATWRSGRRSPVRAPCRSSPSNGSAAISGNQRQSVALRGNQRQSEALSPPVRHRRSEHSEKQSETIRCTQRQSEALSPPVRHRRSEHSEKQSEAIRSNQKHSAHRFATVDRNTPRSSIERKLLAARA